MHEAVSDILAERAQIADRMTRVVVRMLGVSLAAHAVLIAALAFVPGFWTGEVSRNETSMMLVIGGTEGPDSGGLNPLANRPVQRVAEPDARPERTTPAARAPEMVAPEPAAKPARTPPKAVEKPRETSSSRKPTSGAEIAQGAGKVENPTAAAVPFGGLSTGGGGSGGARVDVPNFCCPSYLNAIVGQIRRNWIEQPGLKGQSTIKFVVRRDGTIENVEVAESGGQLLDIASMRALHVTKRVTELPAEFKPPTLTVYLIFEYSRR